jgi:hypothetical protein
LGKASWSSGSSTLLIAYNSAHSSLLSRHIAREHLKKCLSAAESQIDWLLRLESRPFTLNSHYLSDYKDNFLSHYKGLRQQDLHTIHNNPMQKPSVPALVLTKGTSTGSGKDVFKFGNPTVVAPGSSSQSQPSLSTDEKVNTVMAGLADLGFHGLTAADLAKLLPPDEMEPAINIMAEVRAYFQGKTFHRTVFKFLQLMMLCLPQLPTSGSQIMFPLPLTTSLPRV